MVRKAAQSTFSTNISKHCSSVSFQHTLLYTPSLDCHSITFVGGQCEFDEISPLYPVVPLQAVAPL